MMHVKTGPKVHNQARSAIITITDDVGKAYREHNFHKKDNERHSDVYLPFYSEYKISVNNLNPSRIMLDIDIDGCSVTGNGLVFPAWQKSSIERFVNNNRKFKFVPLHDDRVADPSDMENGIIRIKVSTEVQRNFNDPWINMEPYKWPNTNPTWWQNQVTCGSGMNYSSSINIRSLSSTFKGSNGATVEGGHSNQNFDETTWNGTDESFIFVFHMMGLENNQNQKDIEKLNEYKRLQEELKNKGLI